MYDAPFDALTRLGWSLAGVVVVLLVARAVRIEWARSTPRAVAVILDVVTGAAVLALLAVLGAVVVSVLG